MFSAIGVNCFAGTLLTGVSKYFKIDLHLASSKLGLQTCNTNARIATTPVSSDYSTWPAVKCDAIFANAETWSQAQNAIKYAISNNTKIAILDIRATLHVQYSDVFAELTKLGFEHGYRTCYLIYSSMSFKCGFSENRFAFVLYKKDKNFNVSAPILPETLDTLYDSIGNLLHTNATEISATEDRYDKNCYYELNYDEKLCVPKLAHGSSLKGLAKLGKKYLPGSSRAFLEEILEDDSYPDIRRPNWGFRLICSDFNRYRPLHPQHNRLLTIGEMMKVCGADLTPIGLHPMEQLMTGTAGTIGEWLGLQATHYLQDKWKAADYQIEYVKKLKKFKGGNANPLRPRKFIDLMQYCNSVYIRNDPIIFPEKERFTGQFIEW